MTKAPQKIGIFSGTFDPVHRGHVEACIVALGALGLETLLLMIEKKPRRKTAVSEYVDRANMIELATMDYPSLRMVDVEEDNITAANTFAYLAQHFPGSEYWYVIGSDMLKHMPEWTGVEQIFKQMNICVVLRDNDGLTKTKAKIEALKQDYPDTTFTILPSVWSPVSSSSVKQALGDGQIVPALDPAVTEYIKRHHLYENV